MIKIRNKDNTDEKIVTQGAFEEYFEYLGYTIVNDKKQDKKIDTKEEIKDTIKEDFKTKKEFSRK